MLLHKQCGCDWQSCRMILVLAASVCTSVLVAFLHSISYCMILNGASKYSTYKIPISHSNIAILQVITCADAIVIFKHVKLKTMSDTCISWHSLSSVHSRHTVDRSSMFAAIGIGTRRHHSHSTMMWCSTGFRSSCMQRYIVMHCCHASTSTTHSDIYITDSVL